MEFSQASLSFLAGGGENGELIRNFDWESTSLGRPEHWPASLKTCVRIILTSRQPMFVWWGPELINIYNDAYQAILGGKHPWAMGKPAKEVWREIWNSAVWPRVETALTQNVGTYDESLLLIMERNGYQEETYYTFSYSPVPGEDGEPNGILCANTDDTDRIIGERQLRTLKDLGKAYINAKSDDDIYCSTMQVLKENPQDFPFAILYQTMDDESGMQLVKGTDTIPENLAPPSFKFSSPVVPWQLDEAVLHNSDQIITGLPPVLPHGAWPLSPFQAIALPISKGGQRAAYGALVIGINPYRLLDERYLGFFNLVADQVITGIGNVRAMEEERKRLEALIEIDKAKTVFFNNVSHEFRTPLTLMLGPLEEVLQYATEMPATVRDNLQLMHKNAQRLLKLVNSLLEFSRIEAGRVQASYHPVDIAALTRDLASGFRSIIEKAGLKFEVDCKPISKKVYIDREMWEKIVLNLLSNAFKYTLSGKISVSIAEQNDKVVLKVTDTGAGIPEAELPKMFERFHRVPNTVGRTHEGTGIGLSLINELVKMHHGEIIVESVFGEGSTFTVVVPTGKAHLPEIQVSDREEAANVSSVASMFVSEAASLLDQNEAISVTSDDELDALPMRDVSTTVLVVDDNADMRAYVERLLQPYFNVITVSNGLVALQSIQQHKPALVLSDIMMPLMDGRELVQTIRNNADTARLPVILLSARAGEEARIDGLEAGADDYLVKPFSGRELLTKVRSLITISKARDHSDELLRQLFINAPMAIAMLRGPELKVELANEIILSIWGKTFDQVIGKPILEALPEIIGQRYDELLFNVYKTGERYSSPEASVGLIHKGHMRKTYVNFIYEPTRDTDGNITGLIVLANEITDLVNARSAAQKNAEELVELVKRKDEFMSIASHELKTPITSMKASLQILERMHLEAKAQNFIVKANRQMNRLSVLVTDLLDVTSLQAGKMKFYMEDFCLNEMIDDVIEQHHQSQKTHLIVLNGNPDLNITGDRARLEQVVNNLLSNAIKYSPNADKVVVDISNDDTDITISVRDYGIGIPDDQIANVFDRFYRVEESVQNFSGLGLGLYISSEIIKRHGGQIGASRNEDQGSTFWVKIPKVPVLAG